MRSTAKFVAVVGVCAFLSVLTFYGEAWAPYCPNGRIDQSFEQCEVGIPCSGEQEGYVCDTSTCLCSPPEPVCGDGVLDESLGEQCEVGIPCAEGYTCDESTCLCSPPPGDEGCTPGYWKQEQHFDSWIPTGYAPEDLFSDVFGFSITILWSERGKPQPLSTPTLLQALEANGGGDSRLARHGVAALLNAAHPDVAYPIADVIKAVRDGNVDELVEANELGCPLNGDLTDANDMEPDLSVGAAACGTTASVPGNGRAINLGALFLVFGAVVLLKRWGRRG